MSDRHQELMVFVRAAESGSFSRAGRELGLSQPSVSRIISELEARLGVRLLQRSTRPAVSTNFCLPVKNGWHWLQISTLIFGSVLRVTNELPQAQWTVQAW